MLVDFSVENYGPFREQATISMLKSKGNELQRNLIHSDEINGELLKAIAVFGPNASGKSYLFRAFNDFIKLVLSPAIANRPIDGFIPFRLSPESKKSPTTFRARYIESGIIFDYSVSYNSEYICEEHLSYYPKGQKVRVFERHHKTNQDINLDMAPDEDPEIRTNRNIPGLATLKKFVTPQSTFLSVAAQLNQPVCILAHRGIVSQIRYVSTEGEVDFNPLIEHIQNDPDFKKDLLNALRIADFGITDISIDRFKELLLKHDSVFEGVAEADKYFPIKIESDGTRHLLHLLPPMMDILHDGGILVINEFGSTFHHEICKWIINLFLSSETNPSNAQLLVNTHNQLIMDSCILRRDQIYFVEKNPDTNSSEIYTLADVKNVRKECSFQKAYEFGRFGAKPFISEDEAI